MFSKIAAVLLSASMAAAHMEMKWPYPLRSRFDPQTTNIDYSMTNPLNSDGSNFPCKGYHKNTPWRATADFQAGQSYTMKLSGDTRHGGGSCQLSLSYDNGATFKVIESMVGGCPLVDDWNFQVPSDAPSGKALFAWTWYNLVGNRELYMNCADVNVTGGSGSTSSFAANYPNLWVANVGNGCTTVEGKHTVFPDPGKQVIYGSGLTASSPAFPKC